MIDDFFKDKYPSYLKGEFKTSEFPSVLEAFNDYVRSYKNNPAFTCMGKTLSYLDLEHLSTHFGAYLQQELKLEKGDRVAIQLPNILQFPIALFGAMRAGLIIVNTNPLYTARELEHQLNDSGAKALITLANIAHVAEEVLPNTQVEHVIVTEVGDMHDWFKRLLIGFVIKHVKKAVPEFHIPSMISFREALNKGRELKCHSPEMQHNDVAVIQYTGGTTGVAKGAMLTHANLLANMDQACPFFESSLNIDGNEVAIAPLPLYHIYAFTVHCMVILRTGNHNVLIPNPRDIKAFVDELKKWQPSAMVGLNTLFVSLCNNQDFQNNVDFSRLRLTLSGGMALTKMASKLWFDTTGCQIAEGYGLTETSPIISCNPPKHIQVGSIGLPVMGTEVKVIDESGEPLPVGEVGELCVKGPQVMKGYWNRPDETELVLSSDGWLKTGDIAVIQEDGYLKIVDRKKDMIIVSGFNVYPNEIEDVLTGHPNVNECAVIGVEDEKTGEAVKAFIVTDNKSLSAQDIRDYAKEHLTAYKVPRHVVFRDELPKSNVGKILRRALRDID